MSRLLRAVAALAVCAAACSGEAGSARAAGGLQIASSAYPISFVVRRVAGAHAHVTDLAAPGAEPHDLELTPRQVVEASEADFLFYIGRGFQPAVARVAADLGARAVDVLEGQRLLAAPEAVGGSVDPHVWLDPVRMVAMTHLVEDRAAAADPAHARDFAANARALAAALRSLHRSYQAGLESCERRAIVTSHTAFAYLAARYGLEQFGVAGLDPHAEPSPRRMAEVAAFARRHEVKVIFFETLVSPRIAEAVAEEAGVETAVLDPLESAPEDTGYFGAMRANLRALREALGCR